MYPFLFFHSCRLLLFGKTQKGTCFLSKTAKKHSKSVGMDDEKIIDIVAMWVRRIYVIAFNIYAWFWLGSVNHKLKPSFNPEIKKT
jgi:hypothetical protein